MDYNLMNGGLLLSTGGKLIISSLKSFETRFEAAKTKGMFWFMNHKGSCVYYSDQRQNNALCRMDLSSRAEEMILDKPCYGLISQKDWIYYINENDRRLYRCLTDGKGEAQIIDEQVNSFFIDENCIFYCTQKGIMKCDETGKDINRLSDSIAQMMVLVGSKLAFADKNKQYALSIMDIKTNHTETIGDTAAASLNTDGRYLYYTNRLNDRSIYRVDPEQCTGIRICGESAEYLHIIQDELYFCKNHEWHKISLLGGQSEKLMR